MPQPHDDLLAHAELGDAARKFMDSDLGRCVIGMADQERVAAEKALGKVAPEDTKEIIRLQRIVSNADNFEGWLKELLHNGEQALAIYKQQRDDG